MLTADITAKMLTTANNALREFFVSMLCLCAKNTLWLTLSLTLKQV